MRWQTFGREFHIIPGTLPQKPAPTEQVMSLKRMRRVQSDGAEIEIYPRRLYVKTIKVHHDDDHIGEIVCGLGVTNQMPDCPFHETACHCLGVPGSLCGSGSAWK
jgi:hypothetical protein